MEKMKEYIKNNKRIVISGVVVIVLLVAGGIWFAVQSGSHKDTEPKQTEQIEHKTTPPAAREP